MRPSRCFAVITAFFLIFTICAPLISCSSHHRYTATAFDCFDTVTTFTGYSDSREEFDAVWQRAHELLLSYHVLFDIYNIYDETVNLASVNSASPDGDSIRVVRVDDVIIELIEFGKEMYAATGGKVNIAMGSVLSLWHEKRKEAAVDPSSASLPDIDDLSKAAKHTDIGCILTDRSSGTLTITDPLLRIDVGAIAKGFAVKKVVEALKSEGISGYLLNAGGTVCPIGAKPNGEPWSVGVESPDLSGYVKAIATKKECLVTSGAYQRYYEVDGVRYCHIIDPSTLYPPTHFASVCVITDDPAVGDALSTALFCLSETDGRALLEAFPSAKAIWVYGDMTVTES